MQAVTVVGAPIRIEIWSDVVCPWCYIGKRRFEAAIAQLPADVSVDVSYRAYQLDPTALSYKSESVLDAYARKFGGAVQAGEVIDRVTKVAAADGLEFRLDKALRANTLDAHRLIWLAEQDDSPIEQEAMKERLLKAYFIDGLDIADQAVLADCAAEIGFERAAIDSFLGSDRGRFEVNAEIAQAGELGITAVPTFVIDGRWAIPGAQDVETFVGILTRHAEQVAVDEAADG